MNDITLKLSTDELNLLLRLASDQLFRREFIDLKIPGYKSDAKEVSAGKELVERLRTLLDPGRARKTSRMRIAG